MTISSENCEITLQNFDTFTKNCETYLSANDDAAASIRCYLKALYNVTKRSEDLDKLSQGDTLPELIVQNFDEEQIWQELELQNEARIESLIGDVAKIVTHKNVFSTNEEDASEEEEGIEDSVTSNIDEDEGSFHDSEIEDEAESEGEEDESSEDEEGSKHVKSKMLKIKSKMVQDSSKSQSRKKKKSSIVDDKFFKLSDMEAFLRNQERGNQPNEDSSDESVDMFGNIPSSDDSEKEEDDDDDKPKDMLYSDFFDAPEEAPESSEHHDVSDKPEDEEEENESEGDENESEEDEDDTKNENDFSEETNGEVKKKVRLKLDEDDVDESDDDSLSDLSVPENKDTNKSSFEKRQERLQKKIEDLEAEALSEKPWQLKGEVSAESRPQDALLEEALEFDATTRPAPVTTEETTKHLEDIIKQRIKDRVWDDVVRKEKPVENVTEFKKRLVLDQEKSKLSLAQVYEQEYLKQVSATDPDASEKPEETPKEHKEIKSLVDSLFCKLDALCNFHFTPKQINPEVKIVTNTPAISMEEVAPLATSEATLLAPEEVKAKPQGDVISTAERTDTDKKRERRKKKQKQRFVAREKEKREAVVAKLNPGLGNKYSKEKALKLLDRVSKDKNVSLIGDSNLNKATKSSSAFFSQLQDEVSSNIKQKVNAKKRQKQEKNAPLSAKRLKL